MVDRRWWMVDEECDSSIYDPQSSILDLRSPVTSTPSSARSISPDPPEILTKSPFSPLLSCHALGWRLNPNSEVHVSIWLTLAGRQHEDRLKPLLRRRIGNPASEFRPPLLPPRSTSQHSPQPHGDITLAMPPADGPPEPSGYTHPTK